MLRNKPATPPPPWPRSVDELERVQNELGAAGRASTLAGHAGAFAAPPPDAQSLRVAGCFVCFGRGGRGAGSAGDRGWAGAACWMDGQLVCSAVITGTAGAAYDPGHLALREGPLLEAAVHALDEAPELLLVDATGRDHPRGCGLALHLGARLDVPTIGVTNRLLHARGEWPADAAWARSPFHVEGEIVGYWLRIRPGVRPIAVHAAWRTDAAAAVEWVRRTCGRARTPEPLRAARRVAREARVSAS